MNRPLSHRFPSGSGRLKSRAFTLIELLVVVAIIGILAAVALPRLKGFGQGNAAIAATRQLLDDVALAHATAISTRSEVSIVFVPPEIAVWMSTPSFFLNYTNATELADLTNLVVNQYGAYAIYSDHTVGDQPGHKSPRYITQWKVLPQGMFIPIYKYQYPTTGSNGVAPFVTNLFPFPIGSSSNALLPYIAFDYQGRLKAQHDEVLPLARGSIFYPHGSNGLVSPPFTADVLENPPNNSITLSNHVHIDWLTGRGHVERQDLQ